MTPDFIYSLVTDSWQVMTNLPYIRTGKRFVS